MFLQDPRFLVPDAAVATAPNGADRPRALRTPACSETVRHAAREDGEETMLSAAAAALLGIDDAEDDDDNDCARANPRSGADDGDSDDMLLSQTVISFAKANAQLHNAGDLGAASAKRRRQKHGGGGGGGVVKSAIAKTKASWAPRRHTKAHHRLSHLHASNNNNNNLERGRSSDALATRGAERDLEYDESDDDAARSSKLATNEDDREETDIDEHEAEEERDEQDVSKRGSRATAAPLTAERETGPLRPRPRLHPSVSQDSQSTISTDASQLDEDGRRGDGSETAEPMLLVGEIGRREETNEWLATNLYQFFKEVCLMYDLCSDEMEERFEEIGQGFPPHYEYRWAAPLGESKRRPMRMSGPDYVQHVLGWVDDTINDRRYFPVDENSFFPDDFLDVVKKVYTRLFRVYAILFHHCLPSLYEQDAEDFLHKSFRHFMFLVLEYDLVRDREFKAMRAAVDQVKEAYEASLLRPPAQLVDLGHVITAPVDPQVVAILASVTASVKPPAHGHAPDPLPPLAPHTRSSSTLGAADAAGPLAPPQPIDAHSATLLRSGLLLTSGSSTAGAEVAVPPPVPMREKPAGSRISRLKRSASKKKDAGSSTDGDDCDGDRATADPGARNRSNTMGTTSTPPRSTAARTGFSRALSASAASLADRSSNLIHLSKTHSASAIGETTESKASERDRDGSRGATGTGARARADSAAGTGKGAKGMRSTSSTSNSVLRWLLNR